MKFSKKARCSNHHSKTGVLLAILSIFGFLGLVSLTHASVPRKDRETLEARVLKVRTAINDDAKTIPANVPDRLIVQWPNWPNWPNWGNWPNWFNR
jgi:hypothetical protein